MPDNDAGLLDADDDLPPDTIPIFRDDPRYRPPQTIAEKKRRSWDNPNVCEHRGLTVDQATRTVECRACGAIIDPIEAILIIARNWHEIEWKYEKIREFEKKEHERRQREDARRKARRGRP